MTGGRRRSDHGQAAGQGRRSRRRRKLLAPPGPCDRLRGDLPRQPGLVQLVDSGGPNIASDFRGVSLEDLSSISTAMRSAYAAPLVFFGRLAERHRRGLVELPRKRGAVHGGLGPACAMANSVETLVAFRIAQAAGAALMTPTSLGLLLTYPSLPTSERAPVRAWTAIGGFAAALGPLTWRPAHRDRELAMDVG